VGQAGQVLDDAARLLGRIAFAASGAQPAWPQPAPNAGASGQTGTLGRIGAQSLGQLTKKTWAILVGVALVCGLVGGAIGAAGFSALDGDSRYRVQQMQMPGGIPVATTAVGNSGATNAGLLAVQMLSAFEPELATKLEDYRNEMKEKVAESNAQLV